MLEWILIGGGVIALLAFSGSSESAPVTPASIEWVGGLTDQSGVKPAIGASVEASVVLKSEIEAAASSIGTPDPNDMDAMMVAMGKIFAVLEAGAIVRGTVISHESGLSKLMKMPGNAPGVMKDGDDSYVVIRVDKIVKAGEKNTPSIGVRVAVG